MEDLAPPLKCLIELQLAIKDGESLRTGLARYLAQPVARHGMSRDDFSHLLRQWLFAWDQGHDWRAVARLNRSPYRRILLETIAGGLSGQSIQSPLAELEEEMRQAAMAELKNHLDMLPLRMMLPLLLLMFPEFLILLFGPLLTRFLAEVGQ